MKFPVVVHKDADSDYSVTVPISEDLYRRLKKALPFKPTYDVFRRLMSWGLICLRGS